MQLRVLAAAAIFACGTLSVAANPAVAAQSEMNSYYLPDASASRILTVAPAKTQAKAGITVITQAVAERENETGSQSCLIYAFTPSFIAVRQDEPTLISFRNYQADDDHDFMLADPAGKTLMFIKLPKLRETSYVFTFHEPGIYSFYCTMHQPEMSGQILVVPTNIESQAAGKAPIAASGAPPSAPASLAADQPLGGRLHNCTVWPRELEEDLWVNLWHHNWDGVGKDLAPGFQSLRDGKALDRNSELELIRRVGVGRDVPHDFKITYSGDVAIVTYRIHSYKKSKIGTIGAYEPAVLSVWRHTPAGWQSIARAESGPF